MALISGVCGQTDGEVVCECAGVCVSDHIPNSTSGLHDSVI